MTSGIQADAVPALNHVQVGVFQAVVEDVCNAGFAARGGTHPQDVVVAPLDVHAVVLFQQVHNHIGQGPRSKISPTTWRWSTASRLISVARAMMKASARSMSTMVSMIFVVVLLLVAGVVVGVQQLIDDVGKIAGQGFAHLGTGVFGGDPPADFNEPVKGHPVPLVEVGHLLFDLLQLLFRVID